MDQQSFKMDRRGFLGKMTAGVAALGFVKAGIGHPSSQTDSLQTETPKGELFRRKLGKTGLELPVVSMGVMNTGNSALVKRAWESGIRHFDTAGVYWGGQNEMMLGKALREIDAKDAVIATKTVLENLENLKPEAAKNLVIRKAEESLKRLGMDTVDILYLHGPDLSQIHHEGALEGLIALKQAGKIRFPGFSTHLNMAACINAAVDRGFHEVILTSYNYALASDGELTKAMTRAAEKGIGLIAMKTQCSQYWYRDMIPGTEKSFYEGSLMHSAMLKWVVRHPFITTAVPGFTTFQQLADNTTVGSNLEFTKDEKAFLENKGVSVTLGYCTQCGGCITGCPNGAHVPTLMRAHLYASRYRNFDRAKAALADLPKPGLGLCSGCTTCAARCVRGVDVGSRVSDLKMMFS